MKTVLSICFMMATVLMSCGEGYDVDPDNLDTANTLSDTFPARPHKDTVPKDGTYVDSLILVP